MKTEQLNKLLNLKTAWIVVIAHLWFIILLAMDVGQESIRIIHLPWTIELQQTEITGLVKNHSLIGIFTLHCKSSKQPWVIFYPITKYWQNKVHMFYNHSTINLVGSKMDPLCNFSFSFPRNHSLGFVVEVWVLFKRIIMLLTVASFSVTAQRIVYKTCAQCIT